MSLTTLLKGGPHVSSGHNEDIYTINTFIVAAAVAVAVAETAAAV